jgi:site-specific DNA-methyltransferase (adenine-specific)
MNFEILTGDNKDTLKTLEDNSIDAIVTDPPYGISFLGKDWDSKKATETTSKLVGLQNLPSGMKHTSLADDLEFQYWMRDVFSECLRVLKPGGYLLAFSAARTYHHMAMAAQTAGFEVRDQLMWLYASGFPKAQDIGKAIQRRQGVEEEYTIEEWEAKQGYSVNRPGETMGFGDPKNRDGHGDAGLSGKIAKCTSPEAQQWSGWKTALKPAHEPIVMARKPFKGSTIDNVLTHGVGALNIDATRIPFEGDKPKPASFKNGISYRQHTDELYGKDAEHTTERTQDYNDAGRFPSNVIGEVEGYQKFFYCPKVSRKERHCGFEAPPPEKFNSPEEMKKHPLWDPSIGTNSHRLMTKIREHQAKDPLGHLDLPDFSRKKDENGNPVKDTSSWMYDPGGVDKIQKATKKHDPLGHIPAPFGNVKGAYVDGERMAVKHQSLQKGYTQDGTLGRMKDAMHNTSNVGNNHPTVKPVALMRYLIQLVTPPNSVVLDPFNGSGSTGMAAVELGHRYIGCELDPAYVDIATRRITAWNTPEDSGTTYEQLFEEL